MNWKKTLYIFLSLLILLTIGFFIQRPFNNKEVLGVQDSNSKIINRPEESEVKTQPSITPSKTQVQNNSFSASSISKRDYIQGEIDRLIALRNSFNEPYEQLKKSGDQCSAEHFSGLKPDTMINLMNQCNERIFQGQQKIIDMQNDINREIGEWKRKLADTY